MRNVRSRTDQPHPVLRLEVRSLDNDLPKVVSACDLADVAVGFPLLDEHLVAFANSLPADWKVSVSRSGISSSTRLPTSFRAPFSPRKSMASACRSANGSSHDPLRAMALGSLESLRDRGIVRRAFFDELAGASRRSMPASMASWSG